MQSISESKPIPIKRRRAFHTPEAGFEELARVGVTDWLVFMFHDLSVMKEG